MIVHSYFNQLMLENCTKMSSRMTAEELNFFSVCLIPFESGVLFSLLQFGRVLNSAQLWVVCLLPPLFQYHDTHAHAHTK